MYNFRCTILKNQLILLIAMKTTHLVLYISIFFVSEMMWCNGQNVIPQKNIRHNFLSESGLTFQEYKSNANSFQQTGFSFIPAINSFSKRETDLALPSLKTPGGAIFCRMENKLRNTFKVWIKVHTVHE